MARRCWLFVGILGIVTLSSCQRAEQYRVEVKKPAPAVTEETNDADANDRMLNWLEPRQPHDRPILFIADDSDEWKNLKEFWNESPIHLGMPTIHIGLDPLSALVSLVETEHQPAIKIKVPRGLPDPTPHFPPSNPPSFGKWKLGKALFFDRLLPIDGTRRSCASCHDPKYGYSDDRPKPPGSDVNTLSLVNAAYNRRQFWDGRVRTLEETLGRLPINPKKADPHNWAGIVRDLVESKTYDAQFNLAFGVERPTQDAVAQALATYIRTILSGDSLYDRAGLSGLRFQPKALAPNYFVELLKDKSIAENFVERDKDRSPEEISALVAKGHSLFYGHARCAECHHGPLFTDHDYHNIGLDVPDVGLESGRAVHVPVGLKEARFIGAYRTPTLRNLLKTGPYFHNGAEFTLPKVVDYFNDGILEAPNRLAQPLLDGQRPRRLHLSEPDREALVMFLRALEGMPVDPIVSGIPNPKN